MRISDWSSDVCSSDRELVEAPFFFFPRRAARAALRQAQGKRENWCFFSVFVALCLCAKSFFVAAPKEGKGFRTKARSHEGIRVRSAVRSEEHTSELQSLMRISYAVFFLKKKTHYYVSTNIY